MTQSNRTYRVFRVENSNCSALSGNYNLEANNHHRTPLYTTIVITIIIQSRTSNPLPKQTMADSPLRTDAVLQRMADALPTHPPDDDSSDLASSYEAIALLIHAGLAGLAFKLQGFDEEKPLRTPSPISHYPLSQALTNPPPPPQHNANPSPPASHPSGTPASAP